jgi:hypothetical protein
MNMDSFPLEFLFGATAIILLIAIELGYRAGNLHPEHLRKDKEKITATNVSAILGMLGFILVFTFGIVYSRYDSKKELVREEANLIRNAWLRSDFLPEPDRAEAEKLLMRYTDLRIEATEGNELNKVKEAIKESNIIQVKLWDIAVVNARQDMNSDVAALYIESLNEMINQQALRIEIGIEARIPTAIWVMLYLLMILGMFGMGYETSITGSSRRSWLTPIMVISFSLMIALIASLDRPGSSIIKVSQQSIVNLRNWMEDSK